MRQSNLVLQFFKMVRFLGRYECFTQKCFPVEVILAARLCLSFFFSFTLYIYISVKLISMTFLYVQLALLLKTLAVTQQTCSYFSLTFLLQQRYLFTRCFCYLNVEKVKQKYSSLFQVSSFQVYQVFQKKYLQ